MVLFQRNIQKTGGFPRLGYKLPQKIEGVQSNKIQGDKEKESVSVQV